MSRSTYFSASPGESFSMTNAQAVTAILYPYAEHTSFDWTYYLDHHIPLARRLFDEHGLITVTVDRGLHGTTPDTPPPFVAVTRMEFASMDSMTAGVAAVGAVFAADVANFTDIVPVLQTASRQYDAAGLG
ncbi:EthD family reductase [Streptomyces spongiae]|uniref:EthD family reductase n=2 Tax=Streptomyces spongiae TaxID=565072 RepID=A0A5N8XMN8_9ACTN|nr:EthD family reductase [Streptomyces spongiae]